MNEHFAHCIGRLQAKIDALQSQIDTLRILAEEENSSSPQPAPEPALSGNSIKTKARPDDARPAKRCVSNSKRAAVARPGSVAAEPGKAGAGAGRKRKAPTEGSRAEAYQRRAAGRAAVLQMSGMFSSAQIADHLSKSGVFGFDVGTRIYSLLAKMVGDGEITKEGLFFIIGVKPASAPAPKVRKPREPKATTPPAPAEPSEPVRHLDATEKKMTTLPATFTMTDIADRLGSHETAAAVLEEWMAKGWIREFGAGRFARGEGFPAKS